jgi:hypothetical protein
MKGFFVSLMIALVITAAAPSKAAYISGVAEQYMVFCTETQEHGGQEYALTSWLDSREAANEAGKAHERATRGHRWTVRTRQKPESSAAMFTAQTLMPAALAPAASCEGNACDVVSVTWDSSAQRYLVSNRSSRRVKVELRNWATTNTIPLGPNESKHSFVAAYINPYRAYYE